jgi:hypothetical protein
MSKPVTPLPVTEHLARAATSGAVVQVVVTLLLASLAVSRAAEDALSPLELCLVVSGAAAAGALVAWPAGLYGGASDLVTGAVLVDVDPPAIDDPFAWPDPWRRSAGWALAVGLWAAAGTALAAVVLDGRYARLVVVAAGTVLLAGVASTWLDALARARGIAAARQLQARPPAPLPVRTRAWRQIALPLAAGQVLVNAGVAWVLFHDAGTPAEPLTDSVAMADVTLVVVLVTVIFGSLAGGWGRVDAVLGRVGAAGDDLAGVTAKAPLGPQGVVYIAVAGQLLGRLATMVLPSEPPLAAVMVVRGLFAGLLCVATVGVAYVRGALNSRAAEEARA